MRDLQVYLFGDLQVVWDKRPIQFRDRTTRTLFAYLVTRPNHSASRSQLIEAFWADSTDAKARSKLSVYLSYLRVALGDSLYSSYSTIQLDPTFHLWVDTENFQELIEHIESPPREPPTRQSTTASPSTLPPGRVPRRS